VGDGWREGGVDRGRESAIRDWWRGGSKVRDLDLLNGGSGGGGEEEKRQRVGCAEGAKEQIAWGLLRRRIQAKPTWPYVA